MVESSAEECGIDGAEEVPLPSHSVFDHGAGLREVSIIKAIEEYLAYHNLAEPLTAFRREVASSGLLRNPSSVWLQVARDVEEVLETFDAGDRDAFRDAWQRVIPAERQAAPEGRALELRLQAFFATYSIRQILQDGREPEEQQLQALDTFRDFLSERGKDEVGGNEALMPLFALPFVQHPHKHPDVRQVFSQDWLQDLRKDVEAELRLQQPTIPLVYDLLEKSPSAANSKRSWQSVWAELLRLADGGLDTMALLAQGVPVAPSALTNARQQLELLREHVPGGLGLQLKSRESRLGPMSPARSVRSRAATARPQLPQIDFSALRRFICAAPQERSEAFGNASTLPSVLRAVLHRLTSAESRLPLRRGFLVAVFCFDVLGVRCRPTALPALLDDSEVSELTLGILAALACEAGGRSYIVSSDASLQRMIHLLKSKPLDSSVHIQVLAAMQRLSLRRSAQDRMIEMGLVEWAVYVLGSPTGEGHGMPSEFSLEFGSAMLMNLALRSAGKRRCLEQDMLPVAMKLMEHWNPQIRTHINGTLYSLLSLQSFRDSAQRAGLEAMLRSIHSQASSLGDDISVRQIEYLLEELNPEAYTFGSHGIISIEAGVLAVVFKTVFLQQNNSDVKVTQLHLGALAYAIAMSMQSVMLVPITFGIVLAVFALIAVIVLIIRGHTNEKGCTEEKVKAISVAVGVEADVEASVQEIFLRDEDTICTICLDPIKRAEPARQMYCNHAFHSKCLVEMCRRQRNHQPVLEVKVEKMMKTTMRISLRRKNWPVYFWATAVATLQRKLYNPLQQQLVLFWRRNNGNSRSAWGTTCSLSESISQTTCVVMPVAMPTFMHRGRSQELDDKLRRFSARAESDFDSRVAIAASWKMHLYMERFLSLAVLPFMCSAGSETASLRYNFNEVWNLRYEPLWHCRPGH
eukprot:s2163_g6.t1